MLRDIPLNKRFRIFNYNLKKEKVERDWAIRVNSGKKQMYEIETEKGFKIKASEDHKFFVKRGKDILEIKLKKLNVGDKILVNKF